MQSVAIVGAGFSGSMVAVHLLRRAMKGLPAPENVFLMERGARFCEGVAYATSDPQHLLNVPVGRMSAFEDDPDHFLRWSKTRDERIIGGTFVPRHLYGEYIACLLRDTHAAAVAQGAPINFERVRAEVVDIAPGAALGGVGGQGDDLGDVGGWSLKTGDGAIFDCDACVLALGHYPSRWPGSIPESVIHELTRAGVLHANPWKAGVADVAPDAEIAILGTGLTMTDMVMSLQARGHRGRIWAFSRRGLLSQAHRIAVTAPKAYPRPAGIDQWPRTALGLLRALRREVERGAEQGVDWREVVTSIRHDTPALWQSMPEREKARFLRHLQPYWDTHRHRAAPQSAEVIDRLIGEGRLRVVAGRLRTVTAVGAAGRTRARVAFEPRGGAPAPGSVATGFVEVDRVINCTGPDADLSRVQDTLIGSLRGSGLIRPDALGIGLDTNEAGAVVDAAGRARRGLWAVGPLRKGKLWENTAVPELRIEVERMAGVLSSGTVQTAPRPISGRVQA